MKLKAAVTLPVKNAVNLTALMEELNSHEFSNRVFNRVLRAHLGVPNTWGPAEFYTQKTDRTVDVGIGFGCEVRLTGVSVTEFRKQENRFQSALKALEDTYRQAIVDNMLRAEKVQLFVVIMLDSPIDLGRGPTTLLENSPVWVMGNKEGILRTNPRS